MSGKISNTSQQKYVRWQGQDVLKCYGNQSVREILPDPTATVEKVRAMMAAEGIRPEDNAFTTELMRMRYEED